MLNCTTNQQLGGSLNRDDFGFGAGKDYVFKVNVDLAVQVGAIAQP